MMQLQPKTQLQRYYSKLKIITKRMPTISNNQYQLCKQIQQDPYQFYHKIIKNLDVSDNVLSRLKKIRNLPHHQNVVGVCAKGYNPKKNQVYILSEYLEECQNLQNIIRDIKEKKRVITQGQVKFIVYQIIQAMLFLQQNKINHLRLNPTSILIKFPKPPKLNQKYKSSKVGQKQPKNPTNKTLQSQQNSQLTEHNQSKIKQMIERYYKYPLVRVCDIGISSQHNYKYEYCLHPDSFNEDKFDPYLYGYERACKHDFWAIGALIYQTLKQKKPFYGRQKMFSQNQIFKTKYAKDPKAWLTKKIQNNFIKTTLLENFVYKCWGIYGQRVFQNWKQAKEFYQRSQFQATRLQKMPIDTIFTNHIRLIFLFSKIYVIMNEEAFYRKVGNNQNAQQKSKEGLLKLASYLFQLADAYHIEQFQNNFKNRCYALPLYKRKILDKITQCFINQLNYIRLQTTLCRNLYSFDVLIQQLTLKMMEYRTKDSQRYQKKSQKLKILQEFYNQLMKLITVAQNYKFSPDKDWCQVISVMYQSPIFKDMANKLGFYLPDYPLSDE